MPDHLNIDYKEIRRQAVDAEQAEIVTGHLAARRVQRRVITICSVLVLAGVVMLGSALLTGIPIQPDTFTPVAPKL